MAVTNYKGARYRDVTVTKNWGNVPEYLWKEVTVRLQQNGNLYGSNGEPKVLNSENGWSATWPDLPNYKSTNELHAYTVVEDSLGGGFGTPEYSLVSYIDEPETGNAKTLLKVTNSYSTEDSEPVTITGPKTVMNHTGSINDTFNFTLQANTAGAPMGRGFLMALLSQEKEA